jgi:hypothetical protein
LEDSVGSHPLVAPTLAHLRVMEDLPTDARGVLRAEVVDVAAQWAQFAGGDTLRPGQTALPTMSFPGRGAEWCSGLVGAGWGERVDAEPEDDRSCLVNERNQQGRSERVPRRGSPPRPPERSTAVPRSDHSVPFSLLERFALDGWTRAGSPGIFG